MVLMLEYHSPTAIIASANPINGEWSDPEKIDLDEIPAMKPLIDRFDLIFVTRNIRNEQMLRAYARQKADLYSQKNNTRLYTISSKIYRIFKAIQSESYRERQNIC